MESYAVDIDPSQVVQWIRAEQERSPSTFRITARRSRQVREIPARQELHLGDEEREDLNEIATIATLEVAPAHPADGWLLRIVVEDEVGPRISTGEMASAAEQQTRPRSKARKAKRALHICSGRLRRTAHFERRGP
jgi:hypothetical protein